jgi:capsular polysaccharide biosynthesis protein
MGNESIKEDVISSFIEIILARKALIITGMLSVIITSAVGVYFMPSTYKASTKIIVTPPAVPRGNTQYFSDLGTGPSFINNQREIIRSKRIYEQVVIDLRLHETLGVPTFFQKAKKTYLQIERYPFEEAVDALYSNTSVETLRGTNIIQITVNADSSVQSSEIANAIARTYTSYINTLLSGKAQYAYNSLEAEFKTANEKYLATQKELNVLQEQVSPMTIANDFEDYRKKLNDYELQYGNLQDEIYNLENSDAPQTPDVPTKANEEGHQVQPENSPRLAQIERDLKQIRNALSIALTKNTEQHPDVRRLRDHVRKMEEDLAREQEEQARKPKPAIAKPKISIPQTGLADTKLRREKLLIQKEKIATQIQNTKDDLKRLTMTAANLSKKTQEANTWEKDYLMLRERLENARVFKGDENEKKEGTIKVIEPARPPGFPDNKKKIVLFAVGVMASILFGLGLAFIAEYVDDSFRNRDDAQKYLGLPILGTIPLISRNVWNGKKGF